MCNFKEHRMLIRIKNKKKFPLLNVPIFAKQSIECDSPGLYFKSVLVEGRLTNNLLFTILNTYNSLPSYFDHVIFCSDENFNFIKRNLKRHSIYEKFELIKLDFELNRNSYNNLLLSKDFWKSLNCNKALIYQTDTFVFKEINDCFLKENFIGASSSLRNKSHYLDSLKVDGYRRIMNGGLSFRDVDVMIEKLDSDFFNIINKPLGKLDKIEEDLYFSIYTVHKNKSNCLRFAFEEYSKVDKERIKKINPYGCHAYNYYFDEELFMSKWDLKKYKL